MVSNNIIHGEDEAEVTPVAEPEVSAEAPGDGDATTAVDVISSEAATAIETEAEASEPAAAVEPEAEASEPAAAVEPEAEASEPAAAVEPEAEASEPAAAVEPEAEAIEPAVEIEAEASEPVAEVEPEAEAIEPAAEVEAEAEADVKDKVAEVVEEVIDKAAEVAADVKEKVVEVASEAAEVIEAMVGKAAEIAAEVKEEAAEAAESMEDWLKHEDAKSTIRRGDILDGAVVQATPTEILIDIGAKAEGIISGRELEQMDRETFETLQPGSTVVVYVLSPEGRGGSPVLSLSRAQEETDWRDAEEYHKSQKVYESKVNGYNKGGLIVRFGRVRGFVPASQISAERRRRSTGSTPNERWGAMVGENIMVKVVEVDRGRNRLILSERAAASEWRKRQKEALMVDLTVGEVRTGRVISIADFGVFVDLGGADGLVHLTELTWKHITHPKELVKIGQEVTVKVISVDRDRKRIGLSMRLLEEDPWQRFGRTHQVGQLVQGTITKLTKFGAFSQVVGGEEVEGLIHISELSDTRVGHPREVVSVGDVLTLRVIKFDSEQRRLGLSIKQVNAARYADLDWQIEMETDTDGPPTIGDVVGYVPEPEKEISDE